MKFTWLHVSDFHFTKKPSTDRDIVLQSLIDAVKHFRVKQKRAPDLIFATGDIAQSGQTKEYKLATDFFDRLIAAADLERSCLHVVPGNHDVDREKCDGLKRTFDRLDEADNYFAQKSFLHIREKQRAFQKWHDDYFNGIRRFPKNSTCGPVTQIRRGEEMISILPINTALFCQADDDHEKLWVGRKCVNEATTALDVTRTGLTIAIMHHPFHWLHGLDRSNVRAKLQGSVDFVLRGHVHEDNVEEVANPAGRTLHFSAGTVYERQDRPKKAFYCTVDGDKVIVFPICYQPEPIPIWTVDTSLFPKEQGFEKAFSIPRLKERDTEPTPLACAVVTEVKARRIPTTIPARYDRPFVARETELAELRDKLGDSADEKVVVLHGPPGVGKSELAFEFARRCQVSYPGGTFLIRFGHSIVPRDLIEIGKDMLDIDFAPDLDPEDQCRRTFRRLGEMPTLLVYDNVQSAEKIRRWLPPAGMPCHVIVTTFSDQWGAGIPTVPVRPFSKRESLDLIRELSGKEVCETYGKEIVAYAEGLPMQICPAALALAAAGKRHRGSDVPHVMAREMRQSFGAVYRRLNSMERLVMHVCAHLNADGIYRDELLHQLEGPTGVSKFGLLQLVNSCLHFHLLDGDEELRIHQLLARFIEQVQPSTEVRKLLIEVRKLQASRFVELAGILEHAPADAEISARFLTYPLPISGWQDVKDEIDFDDGATIGRALYHIGLFKEALPWYVRTVEAKQTGEYPGSIDSNALAQDLTWVGGLLGTMGEFGEATKWHKRAVKECMQGDLHGRIDHSNLGVNLHEVGWCLFEQEEYKEALSWLERAVDEKKQGNLLGRIDHQSLGVTLHLVGRCLSEQGKHEEARGWYEQAVDEKKQGNLLGRIDHQSLGVTFQEIGRCFSEQGKHEEARGWYEQAVDETNQADGLGRIDHDGVGSSLHQVGWCLFEQGEYKEALSWLERAVDEKKQGNLLGRINHQSLGVTLHLVGRCFSEQGKHEEARGWYEQAVDEKKQGNLLGRIDHQSLGVTLHLVGRCLSEQGKHEEARGWYEQAVDEKKQGNLLGRIDHQSLGVTFHEIGRCLSEQGKHEEARGWYEQAVDEKKQGNLLGRIDHQSLGVTLHLVGRCLFEQEKYKEALGRLERAIDEKKQGNLLGRINHQDLGVTLHLVGRCLFEQGQHEEALGWLERAVEEKKQGDLLGRINRESLGRTYSRVGWCDVQLGQYSEALNWFDGAIDAIVQGDLRGEMDHTAMAIAHGRYGNCLTEMGRYKDAVVWFESAMKASSKAEFRHRTERKMFAEILRKGAVCLRKLRKKKVAAQWEKLADALSTC